MSDDYDRLADALNQLPNGFPRTQSGVEIAILKKIFNDEEARLASVMGKNYEKCRDLAAKANASEADVEPKIKEMLKRGLVRSKTIDGEARYRLAPWLVGIYEEHLDSMDHEFAHLVEEYFAEGGIAGVMRPNPTIHRVIPALGAVKTEWILPYDDVKAILEKMKTFNVRGCVCRVQQSHLGNRKCDFPVDICLNFSTRSRPPRPGDISKDEALAILDKAEDLGLVHTVSNIMEGLGYVCNCCGCCCAILRAVNEFGVDSGVFHANYYSEIDAGTCIGCGACVARCQMHAIELRDGIALVDRGRCIGCGLCSTKCPSGAAVLKRKPVNEIVDPPRDYEEWEEERLRSRGLAHQ